MHRRDFLQAFGNFNGTVNELTGAQIKGILEDLADNLFHPDPYLQPNWELVSRYLRAKQTVTPRRVNAPRLLGVKDNPGLS